MKIKINDLDLIWKKLIESLEESGVKEINVTADFYWNIITSDLYDSYETPCNFDVGQLSEDWDILSRLLEKDYYPTINHFVNLAALLRAIGERK